MLDELMILAQALGQPLIIGPLGEVNLTLTQPNPQPKRELKEVLADIKAKLEKKLALPNPSTQH